MATDHALHFFDRDMLSVPVLTDKNEWEVSIKPMSAKINELVHVFILFLFFFLITYISLYPYSNVTDHLLIQI